MTRRMLTDQGAALFVRAVEGDDDARAQIYDDAPGVTEDASAQETLREAVLGFAHSVATWMSQARLYTALYHLERTATAHKILLLSLRESGAGDPEELTTWAQEATDTEAAARSDLGHLEALRIRWHCDGCGVGVPLPLELPDVARVGAVDVGRALHAAGLVLVPSGGLDDPAPQLCAQCRALHAEGG